MNQWQPIETAPIDRTDVLVAAPARDGKLFVSVARCLDGEWHEVNHDPSDMWGGPLYPTHWMPLPDPPPQENEA